MAVRILRIVFPVYVTFIVLLSLAPTAPAIPGGMSDKLAHFGAYALMALLGMPLVSTARGRWRMLLFVIALGAALEAMQEIIPRRDASALDLASNAIGGFCGGLLWLAALRAHGTLSRSTAVPSENDG